MSPRTYIYRHRCVKRPKIIINAFITKKIKNVDIFPNGFVNFILNILQDVQIQNSSKMLVIYASFHSSYRESFFYISCNVY